MIFAALFILLILGIYYRYRKINEIIENEVFPDLNYVGNLQHQSLPQVKVSKLLKTLSNLHLIVHETISTINQIFAIPIVISIGFSVGAGVFSIYELLSVFSAPNATIQQIGFCLMVNSWLPNAFLTSILEISCCMLAVNEGKRTNKILKTLICNENDEKIRNRLRLFLLQICHSKPSFSCGLFEFHWKSLGVVRIRMWN